MQRKKFPIIYVSHLFLIKITPLMLVLVNHENKSVWSLRLGCLKGYNYQLCCCLCNFTYFKIFFPIYMTGYKYSIFFLGGAWLCHFSFCVVVCEVQLIDFFLWYKIWVAVRLLWGSAAWLGWWGFLADWVWDALLCNWSEYDERDVSSCASCDKCGTLCCNAVVPHYKNTSLSKPACAISSMSDQLNLHKYKRPRI